MDLSAVPWEYDYVKGLFHDMDVNIKVFNDNFDDIEEGDILLAGKFINFDIILRTVRRIKPSVIFYMSDEGLEKTEDIKTLQTYARVFCQYNHGVGTQIPLGYASRFLQGPPKLIKDRSTDCSFIGARKSDRETMLRVFSRMEKKFFAFVGNTWQIDTQVYSPQDCFNIYNNSIFVVCGRGNVSLDCFRIYEAIVAGSIPVIVGSEEEVKRTFYYDGDSPLVLYHDTWEQAYDMCCILLENKERLQEIQDALLMWWSRILARINTEIKKLL